MPKREKTPSPGPDEPKFLSIYYPFPPYVTLEEESETHLCARWLSCFIGKDNLYAMFHKPSSPNTIIVEISNELTDAKMRNILGLHNWDEVFVTYDKKEGITHSKIFYSTFRSRREVEKTGWKIVEVQDEWFKGFNPTKGKKVKYPYPPTTFCEPPGLAEEVSALVLFRYLPADIFPEARRRPAITETASASASASASAAAAAPQPRVVPGSGGVVVGASNTGGKGKKKKGGQGSGNGGVDPTVRQTAPLPRPAEASAKAKAIHNQTAKMTFKAYEEDSDDDDVGFYQSQTDDYGPDASEDKGNPDKEVEQLEKEMKNANIKGGARAAPAPAQQYNPLIFNKPKEDDDAPLCPDHKKRCKPGICEWAAQQRRLKKQRESRTGGISGQNQRRW